MSVKKAILSDLDKARLGVSPKNPVKVQYKSLDGTELYDAVILVDHDGNILTTGTGSIGSDIVQRIKYGGIDRIVTIDLQAMTLLEDVLTELKKANKHLEAMTEIAF